MLTVAPLTANAMLTQALLIRRRIPTGHNRLLVASADAGGVVGPASRLASCRHETEAYAQQRHARACAVIRFAVSHFRASLPDQAGRLGDTPASCSIAKLGSDRFAGISPRQWAQRFTGTYISSTRSCMSLGLWWKAHCCSAGLRKSHTAFGRISPLANAAVDDRGIMRLSTAGLPPAARQSPSAQTKSQTSRKGRSQGERWRRRNGMGSTSQSPFVVE